MTLDGAAPSAGQDLESAIESAGEFGRTKRDDARRGQLDRQRDTVQTPADLDHGAHVVLRQSEVRLHTLCPFDEKTDGISVRKQFDVVVRRAGFKRRQCDQLLAINSHSLPAGDQYPYAGTGLLDARDEPRDWPQQMLAVVEYEQQPLLGQHLDQGVLERQPTSRRRQSEDGRDSLGDTRGITQRGELDQPGAVSVPRQQVRRGMKSQAGPAHSAYAGDRHHPRFVQRRGDAGEVVVTPDEELT